MSLDPIGKGDDSKESAEVLKLGVTLVFGLLLAFLVGNLSLKIIGIEVPNLVHSDIIIFCRNIIKNPNFIPVVILCFCYSLYLVLRGLWSLIEKIFLLKGFSSFLIHLSYKERFLKFLDIFLLTLIVLLGILSILLNIEYINIGLASPFALFFLFIIFLSLDIFFDSDVSYKKYGSPTSKWALTVNRVLSNYRRKLINFLHKDFENDREIPFFFFFIILLLVIIQVNIVLVFFFIGLFVILRLYFSNKSVPDLLYQISVTIEKGYTTEQFGSLKAGVVGLIVSSTLFIDVYSVDFIDPLTPILTAFYQNWITFCLVLAATWISWSYRRYLTILLGVCLSLTVISLDMVMTVVLLISTFSLLIIGVILRIYEIREPDIETKHLQEEITRILQTRGRFRINELQNELGVPDNVNFKRIIRKVAPNIQKIHDYHKYPTFATTEWLKSFNDLLLGIIQNKGKISLNNLAEELDINLTWLRDYLDQNSDKIKGISIIPTFKGINYLISPDWLNSFEKDLFQNIRKEKAIKLSNFAEKLDVKISWLRDLIKSEREIIKNSIILLSSNDVNNPIIVDSKLGPVVRISELAEILHTDPEILKKDLMKEPQRGTFVKDSDLFITEDCLKFDQELGDLARDIKRGNAIPFNRLERSLGNIFDGIRFARHFALDTGLILTQIKNRFYLAEKFQAKCQLKNEEITSNLIFYQCKRCFKYLCQNCYKSLEITRMLACPSCGNKDLQELPLTCPQCLITIISVEELGENLLCPSCSITYQTAEISVYSIKEYAFLRRLDQIEKMMLKGKRIPFESVYISVRKVLRHRFHSKKIFLTQIDDKHFRAQSLRITCQICQNVPENPMQFYYCENCYRPICSSCFVSIRKCPYCSGSLMKYPRECTKCQVDFIHPNQVEKGNSCPLCKERLVSEY
ncbi:MAG: hypothetical protein ACFFAM_17935 [Promethearchaeota archaeon]